MKTQWRLLEEGEIQDGDEVKFPNKEWEPTANQGQSIKSFNDGRIYRRPIENQWIALSERKPTKEDGEFIVTRARDGTIGMRFTGLSPSFSDTTHWCRIPEFHEEDPAQEWMNSKTPKYLIGCPAENVIKDAFNAGRDYEKGKK